MLLGRFLAWRRRRLDAEKAARDAMWAQVHERDRRDRDAEAAAAARRAAEDRLMDSLRERALTDSAAAMAYSTMFKARTEATARIKAARIEADGRITAAPRRDDGGGMLGFP